MFVPAAVMHACPQPEHKSSLQMAGARPHARVCARTHCRNCRVRCSTGGPALLQPLCLVPLSFQGFPRTCDCCRQAAAHTHARVMWAAAWRAPSLAWRDLASVMRERLINSADCLRRLHKVGRRARGGSCSEIWHLHCSAEPLSHPKHFSQ